MTEKEKPLTLKEHALEYYGVELTNEDVKSIESLQGIELPRISRPLAIIDEPDNSEELQHIYEQMSKYVLARLEALNIILSRKT